VSDDMVGVVNAGEITAQPDATGKETSGVSTETGSVAPEKMEEIAGGAKATTEGGREEGQEARRRGPTKLDKIGRAHV